MAQQGGSILLDVIAGNESCEVALLRVSGIPVPLAELVPALKFLQSLGRLFLEGRSLSAELFLQINHLGREGSGRLRDHAPEWMPDLGLGIWPDRDPPSRWTRADFEDLGAGEQPRPITDQVLHVTGSSLIKEKAFGTMLGLGAVVEIFSNDGAALLKRTRSLFLPGIKERAFRSFPLYIPLFERKSIESATLQQVELWLCGASVYIRESAEDGGVLIISREPLRAVMERLGGRFESEPAPAWHITY